jgi:predicted phage tail protein
MRVKPSALRAHLGTFQGVAGAACIAGGTFLLWGYGWALLTVGAFLLLGALGSGS